MKKPLLLGMSIAIGLTMSAQGKLKTAPAGTKVRKANTFVNPNLIDPNTPAVPSLKMKPSASAVSKVTAPPYKQISRSYNLLTAIVSESNVLQYNKSLNAVSLTHRQSDQFGNAGANSGNTQITWTSNNGTTWDSLVYGLCNGGGIRYRYPSGAIFNPTGNTTIANAFAVGSGPITDGGNWVGNYYVSGQLNGSNLDSQDLLNGSNPWPTHHFSRLCFDMAGNNAYVSANLLNDVNGTTAATYGFRGSLYAKGVFNSTSNTFDWTNDTLNVKALTQVDGVGDNYLSTGGGYFAWDDNGTVGYRVFLGVDVAAGDASTGTIGARSYQPIVFKTTNGGTNWSQYMPGFNWGSLQTFQDSLISYNGTDVKPFFTTQHGFDVAVDKNGDLHIACQILPGSSNDQDSLAYIFNATNYFYDCYTTSTGWNAGLIDIELANVSADEATVPWSDQSTSPPTVYNVDARLQMSKSPNGDKLFFVWADNDANALGLSFNILEQPELRAKGVDVDTRCWTNTKSYFASGGNFAYFHAVAPDCASPSTGNYQIPVTYVASVDGSNNAINPIAHYYVDDITFADAEFNSCAIGISENEAALSALSVFPNPTSGNATLSVKVKESGDITVNVYNSLGQVVINRKIKGEAGINKINLATEGFASGVYFYEVKAAGYTVTNKMMIQK